MPDEIIDVHTLWSDPIILAVALEEGQAAAEHRLALGNEDETADFGRVRRSGTNFPNRPHGGGGLRQRTGLSVSRNRLNDRCCRRCCRGRRAYRGSSSDRSDRWAPGIVRRLVAPTPCHVAARSPAAVNSISSQLRARRRRPSPGSGSNLAEIDGRLQRLGANPLEQGDGQGRWRRVNDA